MDDNDDEIMIPADLVALDGGPSQQLEEEVHHAPQESSWELLLHEMFPYILSYLDVRTLVEKKMVCRDWRNICTNTINATWTPQTARVFQTNEEFQDVIRTYVGYGLNHDFDDDPPDDEDLEQRNIIIGSYHFLMDDYDDQIMIPADLVALDGGPPQQLEEEVHHMPQEVSWEFLPQDLFPDILSYLDVRTLVEKKMVCRDWRIICTNTINAKRTPQTARVFQTNEELQDVVRKYLGYTLNPDFDYDPEDDEDLDYGDEYHLTSPFQYCDPNDAEDIGSTYGWPIGKWDVSHLDDFDYIFSYLPTFNEDINLWDVSNATTMFWMFREAASFNQSLSNWDTSQVTDMSFMFSGTTSFNQSLSNWDTSQVTDMNSMFREATSFNQCVSHFKTSNVTDMAWMFCRATSFNQSLSNWDTSRVTIMAHMFREAASFNQSVSHFDTSNVTDTSLMFFAAGAFNESLSNWDTSRVTDMKGMFVKATLFNQSLSHFDTSNVRNMSLMFYGARAFNQRLSSWDTNNVVAMKDMFSFAVAFDQEVSSWITWDQAKFDVGPLVFDNP